jgi:hypothetical protein
MIENIQKLWKKLDNKTEFIKLVAEDLDRSPNTLHNHWFARFWQVPEEHQPRVVELLQNTIKNQKQPETV